MVGHVLGQLLQFGPAQPHCRLDLGNPCLLIGVVQFGQQLTDADAVGFRDKTASRALISPTASSIASE